MATRYFDRTRSLHFVVYGEDSWLTHGVAYTTEVLTQVASAIRDSAAYLDSILNSIYTANPDPSLEELSDRDGGKTPGESEIIITDRNPGDVALRRVGIA